MMRYDLEGMMPEGYPGPVTVSELNERIARMFEDEPSFMGISVAGEVSDLRQHGSGHWYFNLKEAGSQLKAVMFRSAAARQAASGFIPENGLLVVALGDIRVYEPAGSYQIIVQAMAPAGEGAKYAQFLKLKEKLLGEGLLDAARKKPVPRFVKSVALITSPSSAAAQDFLKVAKARWKAVRITIVPATMQGTGAAESIMAALGVAERLDDADVCVIARGGGSSEDLWCFNDEALARRIAASSKPVVTGIGHEVDFTIADLVADLRASTPSNAAELVVLDAWALISSIEATSRRMSGRASELMASRRALLEAVAGKGAFAKPTLMVDLRRQAADGFQDRIVGAAGRMLTEKSGRLLALEAAVRAMNPEAVLKRGYSVCLLPDGTVVRHANQAPKGAEVAVRLSDGRLGCEVIESVALKEDETRSGR